MLHHGLDFHTVRVICKHCGWERKIAHSGCADGKRALVNIFVAKDSSHVLEARIIEVSENIPLEKAQLDHAGFRDLVVEARQKGLYRMLDEFLPLLSNQSCPRCKMNGYLALDQIWNLGSDVRY